MSKTLLEPLLRPLLPLLPQLPAPILTRLPPVLMGLTSSSSSKVPVALIRPLLPFLPYLPAPLLTLIPALLLHLTSHSSPTPTSFLRSPLTHPLHLPLLVLGAEIPLVYVLGLISGNVSWVDRAWPLNTPFFSALILLWAFTNESADVYGHNLPRLCMMMLLQSIWSVRLLSHAIPRGFYDLKGEDYRYTAVRKLVPRWFFSLFIHPIVVALAQPILLFALALPMYAVLTLPPSELAPGHLHVPFSVVMPLLPMRFHTSPPSTPILGPYDLLLIAGSLVILYVEAKADRDMQVFQNQKHRKVPAGDLVHSAGPGSRLKGAPALAPYPKDSHPGFPVKGLWRWSRHPNFAAEQSFWLCQALFVVTATEGGVSGVTRMGWIPGQVFAPPFALAILFKSSTILTEYLTECKYPLYKEYKSITGQFLPQETAFRWLWGVVTGSRTRRLAVLETPPRAGSQSRK